MSVQLMVYVYLAVCASMIIFNCVCIIRVKKKDQDSSYRNNKVKYEVKKALQRLNQGIDVDRHHIEWLSKKCLKVGNFASLDEELDLIAVKHQDLVDEYVKQISDVFIRLAFRLNKKDSIQKAHYAYMLNKYNIVKNYPISSISQTMLAMVQSPNLYCRENALKVFYSAGNGELVADALQILSDSRTFHHEKLIVDGLCTFSGDKKGLMDLLISRFEKYNTEMQDNILNFIRFGGGRYDEFFYKILSDDNRPDELRFSAIRYFAKYKYDRAYDHLIFWAENPQLQRWEYAAISCTALASYRNERTINALKADLSNYNWYIRKNAADSIERFNLPYQELADIYDGRDRYAREILQYQSEMKKLKQDAAAAKALKGNA